MLLDIKINLKEKFIKIYVNFSKDHLIIKYLMRILNIKISVKHDHLKMNLDLVLPNDKDIFLMVLKYF